MRMIQPVVLMVSPSLLLVPGACVSRLEDEHDDQDDHDECSDSDADSHGCLLSWSMTVPMRGGRAVCGRSG